MNPVLWDSGMGEYENHQIKSHLQWAILLSEIHLSIFLYFPINQIFMHGWQNHHGYVQMYANEKENVCSNKYSTLVCMTI